MCGRGQSIHYDLRVISIRRLTAALVGLLLVVPPFDVSPAYADETASNEPAKIDLVLDVSGSMAAADVDGRTRISVAQEAFNEVVDALPSETELGIRVLGATYDGDNKTIACQDTQQLIPVSTIDKTEAKNAIATMTPTGYTPVGLALREAAEDLGTGTTTRRIILITDGEDTCAPPDPCEVARELAAQGLHLVIDTLGLIPDENVRKQLLCIATATGGSYFAAENTEDLTNRINQLVDRATTTYTKTPALVSGTDQCADAPLLTSGVYTDRELFSQHRWYRVAIKEDEELRASVSVTLDRSVLNDYGVLLTAMSSDGQELVRGTDAGSGRTDVISTGIRWSATEDDDTSVVCVVVTNALAPADSTTDQATGLPVELVIDVVDSSPAPISPGLGKGWILLVLLSFTGLIGGVLAGWVTRAWIAFRRVA